MESLSKKPRKTGWKHSPEIKAKMSVAQKKRTIYGMEGKKHSEETRLKMRESAMKRQKVLWSEEAKKKRSLIFKGENNPNWKTDRTKLYQGEKKHLCSKYKEWAKSIKDRDNWVCRIADDNCKGNLEAHHILPWRDYPELRYKTNNGITLCHAHHPRARAEEKRLIPTFLELVSVSRGK